MNFTKRDLCSHPKYGLCKFVRYIPGGYAIVKPIGEKRELVKADSLS